MLKYESSKHWSFSLVDFQDLKFRMQIVFESSAYIFGNIKGLTPQYKQFKFKLSLNNDIPLIIHIAILPKSFYESFFLSI